MANTIEYSFKNISCECLHDIDKKTSRHLNSLLVDLHTRLEENLSIFKRTKADNDGLASAHFYEYVCPNSFLDDLEEITKINYARWGDKHVTVKRGKDADEYFGLDSNGEYIRVGLRWSNGHSEWNYKGSGSRTKIVRTLDTDSNGEYNHKPQIILTCNAYRRWIKMDYPFAINNGGRNGSSGKRLSDDIIYQKEWRLSTLTPLKLWIPIKPDASRLLFSTAKSRMNKPNFTQEEIESAERLKNYSQSIRQCSVDNIKQFYR